MSLELKVKAVPGMEEKQQAKTLFVKMTRNIDSLDVGGQKQLRRTIKKFLRGGLSKLDAEYRFNFQEFSIVIKKTSTKNRLIPEKAAEAFENLEKYFILLFRAPWKKEFRKLLTYGGFFQSKVKAHLEDPESILCLVGFKPEGSGVWSLKGEVDLDLMLSVAFECVVASVECEMISEFHRKKKESGALVHDVVIWRETGEMPDLKKTLPNSKSLARSSIPDSAYGSCQEKSSSKTGAMGAEGGYGKNLTYIDEDDQGMTNDTGYVEGTIDEHYMASLKQLSQNDSTSGKQKNPSPQADWSYVTDTLKNRYGPSYYEGSRGDVIRTQRENIRVRNNDELSDEGIDICEEPPAVNIQNPPVRIEHIATRSLSSQNRTRDSGYRTASSSQVYYPPQDSVHKYQPSSPGLQSTSTYVSQTSGRSQHNLIVARGLSADPKKSSNVDSHNRSAQHTSRTTSELMSRNMQALGLNAEWSCYFCTYLNSRNRPICDECGKSRDQGPDVDGPNCGDSITVCKKCTFENEPGKTVCSLCDSQLDKADVHTFV